MRHQRVPDIPIGFRHAVRAKYASSESAANPSSHDATVQPDAGHKPIEISGKVVEEVGFDQIRKKLAALQELKIVILDGMRVLGVFVGREEECDREEEKQLIRKTCPKITELDLSRNLISDWREITDICEQLDDLRILKLKYAWRACCVPSVSIGDKLLTYIPVVTVLANLMGISYYTEFVNYPSKKRY